MKFTINALKLQKALENLQVKGKHLTSGGFSNSNLGTDVYATLEDNTLTLLNGSSLFLVRIQIQVNGDTNGQVSFDSTAIIPYLKSFKEDIIFAVGDYVSITCGTKKASIPKLVRHEQEESIINLRNMTDHIRYEAEVNNLFTFGKTTFEGAFTISQETYANCIKLCELVGSGVYTLNFNEGQVTLSTTQNAQKNYTETIRPERQIGEPATLDFSGALHSFFDKDQFLNFYVKDECPLLIVSNDRLIMKAPYVGGN